MSISKGLVLLTSFHQKSKLSQLLGTSIKVNTCNVVLENILNGFLTAIAFLYV